MKTNHKPATALHGRRIVLQGGYVFEVEHQHAEHLDVLERRANAYPQLVEALKKISGPLAYTHGPYLTHFDEAHDLLRELGEME